MSRKFAKCYLHIGSEKTGTTSLQEFLRTNRVELRAQGFTIPKSMGRSEHVDLVCAFANSNKRFSRRRFLGLKTPEQVEAYNTTLIARIGNELETQARPDSTLIISSERLLTQINEPEEIDALRTFLLRYCEEVEVVCYIRPQHEFAVSIFTTKLRSGSSDATCFPEIDESSADSRFYFYDTILNFWNEQFPECELTVRRFERNRLIGGDTIEDFSHVVGMTTDGLQTLPLLNPSLSAEAQVFLQRLNPHISKPRRTKAKKSRGPVNDILERHFSGAGMLPSRQAAIDFYDQFAESNDRTRRVWFREDDHLFAPSFDKYPEVADDPDEILDLDRAFEIFAKIYKINNQTIRRQQAELDRLAGNDDMHPDSESAS